MSDIRHPEKINRVSNPIPKKPPWIRVKAPTSKFFKSTNKIIKDKKIVTVCEEAACPNIAECWQKKHATFMILGDICTRACGFCNVKTGRPEKADWEEPNRVARSVQIMKLKHCVITSVDRDDLDDLGGMDDIDDVSTKIDLARAYVEMGDKEGAKGILEEVLEEGSEAQKQEAKTLIAEIS